MGVIATLLAVALAAAVLDRRGFLRAVVVLAAIFSVVAAIRIRQARWRSVISYVAAAGFAIWFFVLLPSGSRPEQPVEHTQPPSPTSLSVLPPSSTRPSSPAITTPTSVASPTGIEQATVDAGESAYVLDGAVRISVIGIDFSGTPLRNRVDAVVTEVASGASLTMTSADVGFTKTFGERQRYQIVLLSAGIFSARFEVRRIGGSGG